MSRYEFSDPIDKETISRLKMSIENTRDFMIWLFEESGEIDHITLNEAWDKFEAIEEEKGGNKC